TSRWLDTSMPRSLKAFLAAAGFLLGLGAATVAFGQAPDSLLDPAPLRRSPLTWTQTEREFGFPHWDWVYSGRVVQRGPTPRPLPAGPPIAGLAAGTAGARELERFIADKNVAGLIVLQDGK